MKMCLLGDSLWEIVFSGMDSSQIYSLQASKTQDSNGSDGSNISDNQSEFRDKGMNGGATIGVVAGNLSSHEDEEVYTKICQEKYQLILKAYHTGENEFKSCLREIRHYFFEMQYGCCSLEKVFEICGYDFEMIREHFFYIYQGEYISASTLLYIAVFGFDYGDFDVDNAKKFVEYTELLIPTNKVLWAGDKKEMQFLVKKNNGERLWLMLDMFTTAGCQQLPLAWQRFVYNVVTAKYNVITVDAYAEMFRYMHSLNRNWLRNLIKRLDTDIMRYRSFLEHGFVCLPDDYFFILAEHCDNYCALIKRVDKNNYVKFRKGLDHNLSSIRRRTDSITQILHHLGEYSAVISGDLREATSCNLARSLFMYDTFFETVTELCKVLMDSGHPLANYYWKVLLTSCYKQ